MNCEQISPYLPGFAGGDLRADTLRIVREHVDTCRSCHAEADLQSRVVTALATLPAREVEAPAFLFESIVESVGEHKIRRLMPVLPIPVTDVARVVSEHREQIASAAGTAIVAAGAAYALWRALRSNRTGQQPATS